MVCKVATVEIIFNVNYIYKCIKNGINIQSNLLVVLREVIINNIRIILHDICFIFFIFCNQYFIFL